MLSRGDGVAHALKNVSIGEPFFAGHFPGEPVMPGVLIIEALAQTSMFCLPLAAGTVAYLAGVDAARFKRKVVPGDQLHLHARLEYARRGLGKTICRAEVDGLLVAEAEILFAVPPAARAATPMTTPPAATTSRGTPSEPMRLTRYVTRELLPPLLAGILMFTAVLSFGYFFISSQFVVGAPIGLIVRWIGYQVPDTLVKIFPMAVVLMVVVAFGRMATERELVAVQSGGISLGRMARPAAVIALLVTALSLWLSLWAAPVANVATRSLYWDALTGAGLSTLSGKTLDLGNRLLLSPGSYDTKTQQMNGVRIEQWSPGNAQQGTIIFAQSGTFTGNQIKLKNYQIYTVNYAGVQALGAVPDSDPAAFRAAVQAVFPAVQSLERSCRRADPRHRAVAGRDAGQVRRRHRRGRPGLAAAHHLADGPQRAAGRARRGAADPQPQALAAVRQSGAGAHGAAVRPALRAQPGRGAGQRALDFAGLLPAVFRGPHHCGPERGAQRGGRVAGQSGVLRGGAVAAEAGLSAVRTLILSASFGSGHHQANEAVGAALRDLLPTTEARQTDFLRHLRTYERSIVLGTYLAWLRHSPETYRWYYRFTDRETEPKTIRDTYKWMGRQGLQARTAELSAAGGGQLVPHPGGGGRPPARA